MLLSALDLDRYFKVQGRRYVSDGRLFLNASGASLQGSFQGTSLTLSVWSDVSERGRNAYVRINFDGHTRRLRLPVGEKTIRLQGEAGEHSFKVIKLTESANNSFGISTVETDGDFLPRQETRAALKIEFVGDSITTGFGVLAPLGYSEYKTKEQDFTKAFPYLTAKALSADYQVVAAGGWPIYKSKYADYAIPDFYDNVDLLRNRAPYDFSAFVPDVVVVTLGTNDFSYLADLTEEKRAAERAEVKERFLAFLRRLLALYKKARIILFYGFFEYPDLGVLTREVAEELQEPRISLLETPNAASLSDVRAGHPGRKTHRIATKRLIKAILGK